MDKIKVISTITAALVAVLALLAFVLSYSALQHMAAQNGVGARLSYLWPLLLDFAMIVFSLAILRANLRQERAAYPWLLTVVFAALATVANVLDVTALGLPPVAIAAAVKALAPVALVLAFELLMGMIKAEVKRASVVQSVTELTEQQADLTATIERLTAKRDKLTAAVSEAKADYTTIGDATKSEALAIMRNAPDITGAELARRLEKSPSTGRRLRRELLPVVTANGHGGSV